MKDFLAFRTMLTPKLIQAIFIIGVILCIIVAIADLFGSAGGWKALQVIIVGPLALRISCEILIVFFTINETLMEIKNNSVHKTGIVKTED